MILDTSAIVAAVRGEEPAADVLAAVLAAPVLRISSATLLELGIVIDNAGDPALSGAVDLLLREADVRVEAFTDDQARIARQAYRDFGKGRHPANLNFGDCFAYALAKHSGEPLLFVGTDFGRTDIDPAM